VFGFYPEHDNVRSRERVKAKVEILFLFIGNDLRMNIDTD
jgi:hypothetical protein